MSAQARDEAVAQAATLGHHIGGDWEMEYPFGGSQERPAETYHVIACSTCGREIIAWADGRYGGAALSQECRPVQPVTPHGSGWRRLIARVSTI